MPQSLSGVQYIVYVRDSSFNLICEVDDLKDLHYVARFNDVGNWTATISKASPNAQYLVQGNGIVVADADKGTIALSGPITTVTRKPTSTNDNMELAGADDMCWLARRLVWPAEGYYGSVITDTPIRYYRLGEGGLSFTGVGATFLTTSTAIDVGSQKQNGTYKPTDNSGMQVEGSTAVPFDTDGCIIGTGSGYVDCPTTSMPTGNAAMGLECLFDMLAHPAGTEVLMVYGTGSNHQSLALQVLSTGAVQCSNGSGGTTITSSVLSTAAWHHVAVAWDGTTMTLYVDGSSVGTATPGAQSIPASATFLRIGANVGASPGNIIGTLRLIDEAAVYTTTLTSGRVAAHYHRSAAFSQYGAFSQAAYDTQSGTASTLIDHYVRFNLGPHANIDRWPGNITNFSRAAMTMSADPAVGTSVAAAARMDNLLALCQILALAGGDLGFKLVQSSVGGGGTGALTFTIFQPATKSNVVFSEALGNIADYTYERDVSTDNFCMVGGSGTGTSRVWNAAGDGTALTTFGRIEGVLNLSSTSDGTTLNAAGTDEVAKSSQVYTVTLTPAEITGMVYGVDYSLGDKVTVEVDGYTITDIVREAQLTLSPTDGALWEPTIGAADAQQANSMLKDMLRQMRRSHGKILFLDSVS